MTVLPSRWKGDPLPANKVPPAIGTQWDWVVVALPTALASRIYNPVVSLSAIALLVSISMIRKPDGKFPIQPGPLLCLYIAVGIVFCRPDTYPIPTTGLMVGILILQLITTVDARKIITSLFDGLGTLMVLNVIGHALGLESPYRKIGATNLTGGRILFPLSNSVNYLPNAAAACFVASIFLLRGATGSKRLFRLTYAPSAFLILFSSGSRTALAVAVVLAVFAILAPSVSRWIGQVSAVLAAISAFTLPSIMESIGSAITPLATLNPLRAADEGGIISFQGRAEIWHNVINYWTEKVTGLGDNAFGFGELGQFHSGVSSTYIHIVYTLVDPHPDYANVHNSFLEQFVDGGFIGWFFFLAAIIWASARLSTRRLQWGNFALAATFAMTTVLLGSTTEAFLAPGACGESFWIVSILVGVACQKPALPKIVPPSTTVVGSAPSAAMTASAAIPSSGQ